MNISKRLKAIADLVDTKKVIDVGCDHGYLDIYLTLYKDCKCIATDISKNAIKSCIDNINSYNLKDKIEVMVTDGINGIKINTDDTIVLSGMGAKTIIDILSNKNLPNNIIISSNNHLEELRRFMIGIGYHINNEVYILEHDIHYVIIKFEKGIKEYNEFEYLLGPIVINDVSYQKHILNHYKNILNKIPNKHMNIRDYYTEIIKYIEKNNTLNQK